MNRSSCACVVAALLAIWGMAGCGSGASGGTSSEHGSEVALGAPLPALSFQGVDGESVALTRLADGGQGPSRVLVLRHVAAWCGPCQWQASHTASMLPSEAVDRVKVVDVLLAGEDNGPPTQADGAAWQAGPDADAPVLPDAAFKLAALFPDRASLPLIALVDARTLTPLAALSAPGPEDLTTAIRTALAQLDGVAPPEGDVPVLMDGRFNREEWALLQGMALGAAKADPSNAYEADERAATLGKALFFDGALSPSPRQVSCASCHAPDLLFQDAKDQAPEGAAPGSRNVPTVMLATDQRWQFWDGRADSAWSQAVMPMEDPTEMASSRLFVAHVLQTKYADVYQDLFGALPALDDLTRFPSSGRPGDASWSAMAEDDRSAVNRVFANVGKALAAYERTLRPAPGGLDRYAAGDTQALTAPEKDGLQAFFKAGCVQCHHGPRLTDDAFHVLRFPTGRPDRAADRGRTVGVGTLLASEFLRSGPFSDALSAAPKVAVAPGLLGAFKTPGLRGVALTVPYGHGGAFGGLTSTLEAHRTGGLAPESPYAVGVTERWLPEFDAALIPKIETFLRALTADLPP